MISNEVLVRDYEMVWILGWGADYKEGEESAEKVRALITSLGGEVEEVKPWGKRTLSYPIEKNTQGFYMETSFKMDPSHAPELRRSIDADRSVIRHLIVKK